MLFVTLVLYLPHREKKDSERGKFEIFIIDESAERGKRGIGKGVKPILTTVKKIWSSLLFFFYGVSTQRLPEF